MAIAPDSVAQFLHGKRFAVAGVSRQASAAANAVFRKLRDSGYEVFPVNPNAEEAEGARCYPDIASIHGELPFRLLISLKRTADRTSTATFENNQCW